MFAIAIIRASFDVGVCVDICMGAFADIYIGDGRTSLATLGEDLRRLIGARNPDEERIFIRADTTTRYGDFMQLMNALQDNGFYSVALVGEDNA